MGAAAPLAQQARATLYLWHWLDIALTFSNLAEFGFDMGLESAIKLLLQAVGKGEQQQVLADINRALATPEPSSTRPSAPADSGTGASPVHQRGSLQ
jgi:hypothetical protein